MKLRICNYTGCNTTYAKLGGIVTMWVVSMNMWHVMFRFLKRPFFTLFWGSCPAQTDGQILTIYTSYDIFPCKDVPFGGLVDTAPHLEDQIFPKPPFWGVNRRFQSKHATYSNFCILKTIAAIPTKFYTVIKTSKYSSQVVAKYAPQIPDDRWPPSWKKIVISQQPFHTFWWSICDMMFPHKDVPFGGWVNTAPHLVGQIPKTCIMGVWIGFYQYCSDSNQVLQNNKDLQLLFTVVTKCTWQLQNGRWTPSWKNDKLQYLSNILTDIDEILHSDIYWAPVYMRS